MLLSYMFCCILTICGEFFIFAGTRWGRQAPRLRRAVVFPVSLTDGQRSWHYLSDAEGGLHRYSLSWKWESTGRGSGPPRKNTKKTHTQRNTNNSQTKKAQQSTKQNVTTCGNIYQTQRQIRDNNRAITKKRTTSFQPRSRLTTVG